MEETLVTAADLARGRRKAEEGVFKINTREKQIINSTLKHTLGITLPERPGENVLGKRGGSSAVQMSERTVCGRWNSPSVSTMLAKHNL